MERYDCCGWATRNNIRCSDGRTIIKDAFKHCNGEIVPVVWNHQHDGPFNVLGHAVLENKGDGVYTYITFNDTESGRTAKSLVQHGDITGLSIYASNLQQQGPVSDRKVMHGDIREVSLVVAGANPGAYIENVIRHSDGSLDKELPEDQCVMCMGETLELYHAEENKEEEKQDMAEENKQAEAKDDNKTVKDVLETFNEDQKTVLYYLVGEALEGKKDGNSAKDDEEGEEQVKHNVFDQDNRAQNNYLSHSDEANILSLAKSNSVGSLRDAMEIYAANNNNAVLAHAFDDDDLESLFPEYKDVKPGAPELIERDQGWVSTVMSKIHKSPISRIRTRQMDIRGTDLRAYGYKKGDEKVVPGNPKLLKRTTDPQTVYRKDALNRDDIIDITDFDVVAYQYGIMKQNLNEELAIAIMVGDGREDGDDYKISEDHIRSIWHDDDLYTIHYDVDLDAAKEELQGSNTSANFGENYIYAEAIISAALYAREDFKGSGTPDFFCTPHLLNVMLLARDLNGRRIYDSKSDLAAALNVGAIYTAEQFADLTRTDSDGNTKELLGIFVNLSDYYVGSTKGGEITKFNQFDIDFNQEKYLIETRLSGALTRVYSAIALEMPVTSESA